MMVEQAMAEAGIQQSLAGLYGQQSQAEINLGLGTHGSYMGLSPMYADYGTSGYDSAAAGIGEILPYLMGGGK
jgi:hypothetical protein